MGQFESVEQIFVKRAKRNANKSKFEFQVFGYYLAEQLNDVSHKSLYIKLAKNSPRKLLQEALVFVKAAHADYPPRLFMWKLKQLRDEKVDSKNA